jgi:NitT/TauT family transport system permease protein
MPASYIPGPLQIGASLVDLVVHRRFILDIAASSLRILAAFIVSALLAVPLGFLMSSFRLLNSTLEPIVSFMRYVPIPALLPLFVLLGGIDETPKLLVLFFGTFFQLVLLVKDESDHVEDIFFELAKTLGAGPLDLICDVLIPKTLPKVYDHLRVTLGWCWTYLVIAELIAVDAGIGHAIKEAQRFNDAAQLFSCCIVLGLIGLATDLCFNLAYPKLFPYAAKG